MGGGNPHPLLAVNGDADSFSLCSAGDYPSAQNFVIYKPQNGSYVYDCSTCYPVLLQMVGLY